MNWNVEDVMGEIEHEVVWAKELYPSFHSFHERYAVLLEEVDELWDSIKANDISNMYIEAIQVAAMAIRFLTDCAEYKHEYRLPETIT